MKENLERIKKIVLSERIPGQIDRLVNGKSLLITSLIEIPISDSTVARQFIAHKFDPVLKEKCGQYVMCQIDKIPSDFGPLVATKIEHTSVQHAEDLKNHFDLLLSNDLSGWIESVNQAHKREDGKLKDREKKLEENAIILNQKNQQLSATVEQQTSVAVAEEREKLDKIRVNLDVQKTLFNDEAKELQQQKNEFKRVGGLRLLELLNQNGVNIGSNATQACLDHQICPSSLLKDLQVNFARQNYIISDALLMQMLLCICVASTTGQFIVLTGPPGSGKTSLVKKIADAIGAGRGVVPVRPAWIDTTDLIGFYDPRLRRYQPTSFMDKMVEARHYADLNRLYFLVLDEMNLGRVENYAADFLSQLEKARAGEEDACLQLYSNEIYGRFVSKRDQIRQRLSEDADNEDLRTSLAALLNQLDRYPAQVTIPQGLIFFGTINIDETTHMPSPKFLDRALTIQIPNTELSKLTRNPPATSSPLPWSLSFETTASSLGAGDNLPEHANKIWDVLMDWNGKFMKPLGIRLSHRLPLTFRHYLGAASILNFTDHQMVADTFVLSKILPLISFRDDDVAEGQTDILKKDILQNWLKDRTTQSFPLVREAIRQMMNRTGLIVRYLE